MNEQHNKIEFFEEIESIPREVYYHYTSLDAMYSIVNSHTFRLMSLRSSNDRRELYYKPDKFSIDLARVRDNEEDENTKKYLGLLIDSYEANKEPLAKKLKTTRQPYALCLSDKRDNLTHWDRYANGCTGVAIGFNVNSLKVLHRRMAAEIFGAGLIDLGRALYNQKAIDDYIKSAMIRGYELMKQLNQGTGQSLKDTIEQNGDMFLVSICRNVMKFAKTDAFFDESEYRIYFDSLAVKETLHLIDLMNGRVDEELYKNIRKNFLELVESLKINNEGFAMTRAGIRSYYELCLDKVWGSGAIPEIVLGPMCVQNRNELKRFLKVNGLEGTKVSVSAVPIR